MERGEITLCLQFPLLSPFHLSLHFLILSPFPHSPAVRLPQVVTVWVFVDFSLSSYGWMFGNFAVNIWKLFGIVFADIADPVDCRTNLFSQH